MSKTVFWIASTALLAALAGAWIVGAWRWQAGTEALLARLLAARVAPAGDPVVAVARFTHTGSFNMGSVEPKWSAFRSDQLVVTQRPRFDWDGRLGAARRRVTVLARSRRNDVVRAGALTLRKFRPALSRCGIGVLLGAVAVAGF